MTTEKYKLNKKTFINDDESFWEYEEYRDTSATPYATDYSQFELKAHAEPMTDIFYPYDAYVELHLKLVKAADASAYTAYEDIALINPVSSVFTNIEYLINNTNVEGELLQTTHIPHLVNGLTSYEDSYSKSIAQSYGWAVDTGNGAVADTRVYDVTGSFRRGYVIQHLKGDDIPADVEEAAVGDAAGIVTAINNVKGIFDDGTVQTFLTLGPAVGDPTNTIYDDDDDADQDDQDLHTLTNRALKITDNPNYNAGFAFRKSQTLNSKVKVYKIPLRELVPFVKGNDMIWTGCDIELRLKKASENMIIYRAVGVAAAKLQIHKLSLWMPRLRVKGSYVSTLNNSLIPSLQTELMWNSYFVFSKFTSGRYFNDVIYKTDRKINSIFVLVQQPILQQVSNFSVTDSAVNFRRGHVQIDNISFPAREYDLNYDAANGSPIEYTRMYHTLQKIVGKSFSDDIGLQLTYENFGTHYRMMVFDLDEIPEGFYNQSRSINLVFETENVINHTVHVLCNFEKTCDLIVNNGYMGVKNVRK